MTTHASTNLNQIKGWNNTKQPYENNKCIHEKLEETARIFPANIAIQFEEQTLTYTELNKYSNALANLLISKSNVNEEFVVVYMNRSIELMISIFGILKSGKVYVPITTDTPQDRVLSILQDTNCRLILTDGENLKTLPENAKSNAILVNEFITNTFEHTYAKPQLIIHANQLAYAIFTSGTTGKPKGVLIEHHSVLNRIGWMQKNYPLTENDVLLQKTPISFDVSVWELFWWSFTGARLILLPHGFEKEPEKLKTVIFQKKVSVIHFVPSMFNTFIRHLETEKSEIDKLVSLKYIFCSGEELYSSMVKAYQSLYIEQSKATNIINLYGPTEATVDVTYYNCTLNTGNRIPIGKPIDNTELYIIDENQEVLPVLEKGELIICGVNLARGYLNRDELTSEKFITITVFGENKRAYKTGDIAYYDKDGEIMYCGRADNQIKLRGYRIELGEIENVLMDHPLISECVCIIKNEKEESAHIVACMVSAQPVKPAILQIKDFLLKKLPPYMVPSSFHFIDKIPLSTSGKADRKELLRYISQPVKTVFSIPENNHEKKLQEILSKVLKSDNISRSVNFFEMGGNSLTMAQFSMMLRSAFNIQIDMMTLMQFPTIKSLAQHIAGKLK